ncbi:G-type lectin S-receptor-like serine/threonine-protein kinase At1g11300 [Neltuma alba]|uniref:G-type lectin S-receptor-like serine/threonine-protein kinase At1g11300 n=1 Tax=Neltuma alba TaxID=207710 RepID=UPI0010A52546|nr:G-type lectin S-receptor-like serine/threonine-protein kinase At1g11300 [Prosopis alba]
MKRTTGFLHGIIQNNKSGLTKATFFSSMSKDVLGVLLLISSFYLYSGSCIDFTASFQFVRDPDTISSGSFKLGFFSPGNSTKRYVGIWYLSETTVVWVANRNSPLRDSSGVFTISKDGNLVVLNDQNLTLWSSNVSNIPPNSSMMALLLDTGNLVLKDNTTGQTLWDSFQHPSDSFFPKMKLGISRGTGEKPKLTSWTSPSDPSIGSFSASLERLDAPEVVVYNGSKPYWRSGPWNGQEFLGVKASSYLDGFSLKEYNDTYYISFDLANPSYFGVFKLNSTGNLVVTGWINKQEAGRWRIQHNECDIYGQCGAFAFCNSQSTPVCSCLDGFEPKNPDEWNKQNWTNGCIRKAPLLCDKRIKNGIEDAFKKIENMKTPDFVERLLQVPEENCSRQCLQNCSCLAYAYDAAIGCMSWSGKLIDIRTIASGGVDLYIRLANSELKKHEENVGERKNKRKVTVIAITVTVGATIFGACSYFLWTIIVARSKGKKNQNGLSESMKRASRQGKLEELPLFEFEKVAIATNNFHQSNRLGQGGFGPVYKGELQDSQVIAVKRLSRGSGQGLEEFMNEVRVISKLQHRNLVRLLGCCIEGDERMLVYEYMPNKSLDALLFGSRRDLFLDWKKRYNIMEGIARGLLYLHRDSRLKIIHRDLKASNILLDEELNPKISDFGLAKIFKGDENDQGNTRRVIGTYGYMSPEYAMQGLFSEKSDVFSFGVLLLEIVAGKKNTSFYHEEMPLSLLGFAWKLRVEDNIKSLIDRDIYDPSFHVEILRCIHIGLLCVQEAAKDRPNMSTVYSMLNSEIVNLPSPTQPAFTKSQYTVSAESSQQSDPTYSICNTVTITEVQGR